MNPSVETDPDRFDESLRPELWEPANRACVRKIFAELAHERIIEPVPDPNAGEGAYVVQADGATYRFVANLQSLEHWHIEADSIVKTRAGVAEPLDAMELVIDLGETLAIGPDMVATYLEEVSSTLYGEAYRRDHQRFSSRELAGATFQDIESSMSEGHPCFVANAGRMGFDASDYRAFTPEAANPVTLVWLAAHRSCAQFNAIEGVDHERLMAEELGNVRVSEFRARVRERGTDPNEYLFLPVHPWQWSNKIVTAFAAELATGRLIYLGVGSDDYLPQQSIRTLFNVSRPDRPYVKTALSILNMGFMRGLSPDYMETTPAINQWVHEVLSEDRVLQGLGFRILREFASIGYRHPGYERGAPKGSAHRKMLAALWRESPLALIEPQQRVLTMAALLHRDRDGGSFAQALIERSGVGAEVWIRRYLQAYLTPLLHCFYAHDMAFMPHGENLILVLQDDVPVGAFLKDVGEEVVVFEQNDPMPSSVRRIVVDVPEDIRLLSIFTDVFDCFFRFLVPILQDDLGLAQSRFWELVAECVLDYQRSQPDLAAAFARYDIFAPRFALSCLNRLQLKNNRQLINLSDPAEALQFAGTLRNPITSFRPQERVQGAA